MPNPSAPTLRERLRSKPYYHSDTCNCRGCVCRREAAAALDEAERVKKEACRLLRDLLHDCDEGTRLVAGSFLSAHSPKPKEKENG